MIMGGSAAQDNAFLAAVHPVHPPGREHPLEADHPPGTADNGGLVLAGSGGPELVTGF